MKNGADVRWRLPLSGGVLALVLLLCLPASARAQGRVFHACYVPEVGAVYLIQETGLPTACLSQTHVEFSWTEGTGGIPADGSVTTAKLADASVTTTKLADASVTAAKLAGASVTTAKLAPGAVGSAQVQDESLTAADIAAAAIGTSELQDLAVSTAKLADASVTTAKLALSAVGSAQIQDESLTAADIAAAAIGTSELQDLAVSTAKLADGSVTAAKLADQAVTSAKLAVTLQTQDIMVDTSTLAPGVGATHVGQCPAGWIVLSGGWTLGSGSAVGLTVVENRAEGADQWRFTAYNFDFANPGSRIQVISYVRCARLGM